MAPTGQYLAKRGTSQQPPCHSRPLLERMTTAMGCAGHSDEAMVRVLGGSRINGWCMPLNVTQCTSSHKYPLRFFSTVFWPGKLPSTVVDAADTAPRSCSHSVAVMNASFEGARHCFLPVLVDQAATDRDEDSPHPKSNKTAPVQSKLRERSVYAVPPVPRWNPRRRPRSLSSSSHGSVGPSNLSRPLNTPLRSSHSIDLSAVLEACRRREAMGAAPTPLPPLAYQPTPSTYNLHDSLSHPETVSPVGARLPPLELRVLQQPRLFLPTEGFNCSPTMISSASSPTIGVEEIVQIQEQSPIKSPPRSRMETALRLAILPKKCLSDDEVALMPCHSLGHRGFPELAAELWREPLRDRDKNWQRDELAFILASVDTFAARRRRGIGMTVAPSTTNRGKWRRWEAQKLHLKATTAAGEVGGSPVRRQRPQPDGVLLRNHGAMISRSYCLVSIYGVGLVGRLYDAGVSQREQLSVESIHAAATNSSDGELHQAGSDTETPTTTLQRYLRLEAYEPGTSRVFTLRITLADLSWAFHERPEFLVAGRKLALLRELVALLYFEYPSEEASEDESNTAPTTDHIDLAAYQSSALGLEADADQEPASAERTIKLPVLRLAQEPRLSEAARRRMEREARLRWEEQQRLLALAAFLKLPRRARHRLACKCIKLSGRTFIVSVYHLPAQVRSFVVVAYHPQSSTSFHLTVSVTEIAVLAKVLSLPHTWSTDLRRSLAESVVPRLRFKGTRVASIPAEDSSNREGGAYSEYRAALAVHNDRQGPWAAPGWLPPLERLQTDEMRRAEIAGKRQRDARRAHELAASKESDRVRRDAEQRGAALEKQISDLESRRSSLVERDAELVKLIEEIDSRGGAASGSVDPQVGDSSGSPSSKVHHELRRAHKAARKALKVELKAVGGKITDRKRELQLVHEQAQLDLDKQQRRLKRKLQALNEETNSANTMQKPRLSDDINCDAGGSIRFSQSRTNPVRGQRTWLARALIRGRDATIVSSEACCVEGTRLRYSLFVVGSPDSSSDMSTFRLELYESVSNQSVSLEISRLDWVALTKESAHEQQLLIPELAIPASAVVQRVLDLDSQLASLQRELVALTASLSGHDQAKNSRKSSTVVAKTAARHRELAASFATLSRERRNYSRFAPWKPVVRGLCDRLQLIRKPLSHVIERVEIDRCLFRATLPIISLTNEEDEDMEAAGVDVDGDFESTAPIMTAIARRSSTSAAADDGQVVYCHVRAMLYHEELHFEVFEPLGRQTWRLPYPDSLELVKEFASNSFMEQQLHVEAIALTMVFFVSPRTGRAELRFED